MRYDALRKEAHGTYNVYWMRFHELQHIFRTESLYLLNEHLIHFYQNRQNESSW